MSAPAFDFPPVPGSVLAGKYTVLRMIGRGGMAVVMEARHERLRKNVALKLLLPQHLTEPEVTHRFEREARAAARLTSRHVARVLDVDSLADGTPFMVLELLRGNDLGEELERRRGPLGIGEAVGYVIEACAAMREAHSFGIVHRDLKPSNLFLAESGDRRVVKVLDFGISKVQNDVAASMTATASAFGTPLYMSPEQVRSVRDVDSRTDIWSLGVILYELLVGRPPFVQPSASAIFVSIAVDQPPPMREFRPEIPARLAEAVMRALEKDPDVRWQTVSAFVAAIAPFTTTASADLLNEDSHTSDLMLSSAETMQPSLGGAGKRRGRYLAAALVTGAAAVGVAAMALRGQPPIELRAEAAVTAAQAQGATPAPPPVTPAPTVTASPTATATAAVTAAPATPAARPRPSGGPRPALTTAPAAKPSAAPPPPPDDPKYL